LGATLLGGALPAGGDRIEFYVDPLQVEVVRIERTAVPVEQLVVIGMAGIGHRFKGMRKTGSAADIFGRAAHGAIDEAGIARARLSSKLFFELDAMLPAVTHVVEIGKVLDDAGGELVEAEAGGKRVASAMELMEVIVVPPHRHLDYRVQLSERHLGGHLYTTPDRRLRVGQNDLQTKDGVVHAASLAGAGVQFQGKSSAIWGAG
jgi:hypothetical protein